MWTFKKPNLSIFILLFCIASFRLYSPVFIGSKILKALYLVFLLAAVFGSLYKFSNNIPKGKMYFPMQMIVFSILFSVIPAYVSWGQALITTLTSTLPFLAYILFFFLIYWEPDIEDLEKVIVILGLLALAIYILSFIKYPNVIFGDKDEDEINTGRGFARIQTAGYGFVYLAFFLSINKYVKTLKREWLLLTLLMFGAIVGSLTRQTLILCSVLGCYFLYKRFSLNNKIVLLSFLSAAAIIIIPRLSFVQILFEQTKEQQMYAYEDIRVLSGKYFLSEFSPDIFSRIFGNGEASIGHSSYGAFCLYLKEQFGFFQSDVGFIGFYSKFGIIGILGWVLLFCKVFFNKLSEDFQYLYYFFALVLLTGLTHSMPFNYSYIPAIVIAVYLVNNNLLEPYKSN